MAVCRKQEVIQLLQHNSEEIKKLGVAEIGLFGSFLRDDVHENSDVDILVSFEPGKKNYNNFIRLAYFLENLFGRKTELVTKKGLSRHIGPKILQTIEYVALTA